MQPSGDERPVYIYALLDDSGIRYVGQTTQPLDQRLRGHLADQRTWSAAKAEWMKELYARGVTLQIMLLDITTTAQAHAAERQYIREARREGCRLINGNLGGARQDDREGRAQDASTFGRRMAGARTLAMLTQVELATQIGCTQAQVAKWETGRNLPRPSRQRQIMRALGLTPQEFASTQAPTGQSGDGQ